MKAKSPEGGEAGLKLLWGMGGLALHGLNLLNVPMKFEEAPLDDEALKRAREVSVEGQGALLASLEDHIVYCVLKAKEEPVLLDLAVMMIASRPLDVRYMLWRAERLAVEGQTRRLLSYIHYVMREGWRDAHVAEVLECYYKVAKHYFEAHPDIEAYIDSNIRAYPPLTPYEVIREAWKQIQVEL